MQSIYNTPLEQRSVTQWVNDIFPLQSIMKLNIMYPSNTQPHHIGETSLIFKGQAITPDGSKRITDASTELQGSLLLPLNVNENFQNMSHYDFYIATNEAIDAHYFKETLIEKTNFTLSINNKKYTVYRFNEYVEEKKRETASSVFMLPKTKEKYLIIKK